MTIDLVSAQASDGVRLDGTLRRPDPGTASSLGVDVVVMHHGFSGNFYAPGLFASLQEAFAAAGVAVLRVNSRGHDLAYNSPRGRLGGAYETIDESRLDLRAWNGLAESLGFRRILLWGHSLGAVKTVYYQAQERDARVVCAIASSPPRFSYADTQTKADAATIKAQNAAAQAQADAGRGDEIAQVSVPPGFRMMSARTYLDKWGPAERNNVVKLAPQSVVPLLISVGTEEGVGPESTDWLQFGGLAAQLEALAAATPILSFEHVQGANHAYAGKADVMAELAFAWLKRTAPAVPVT